MAVDIELLADGTDLVTEGNLQRMVGVVDELDDFGNLRVDFDDLAPESRVHLFELVESPAVPAPDNRNRRVQEVGDRHAFAQEFRVRDHSEVDAFALAGDLLYQFAHRGVRSGRNRTADDHNVERGLGADCTGNGFHRRHEERGIQAAIRRIRRTDAQERDFRLEHGLFSRRRRRNQTGLETFLHNFVDIAFDYRRKSHGNTGNLVKIYIAANNSMTELRETRDADTSHIT